MFNMKIALIFLCYIYLSMQTLRQNKTFRKIKNLLPIIII